jgi:dynein heavy chain, axonemal
MPATAGATVFDWYFDKVASDWRLWASALPAAAIPPRALAADMAVPTKDSVRYTFLLDLAVQHQHPFLMVGPSGTGKSVCINAHLSSGLPSTAWTPTFIAFSARTTANTVQEQVDCRLDKRRRGVYGPPAGKRAVVFVDDLGMPTVEPSGAQPPVEVLRQLLDHGGWYGRDNAFRTMVDIQLVAAMAPAVGGRASVTNRFIRHFHVLALTHADDATLTAIFTTILNTHFRLGGYSSAGHGLTAALVGATIDLYRRAMSYLLPTPSKPHYTFSLRDCARLVSGVMLLPPSKLGHDGSATLRRLWVHEVFRVFGDRLSEGKHEAWLLEAVRSTTATHFGVPLDTLLAHINGGGVTSLEHLHRLAFADIMDTDQEPADRRCGPRLPILSLPSLISCTSCACFIPGAEPSSGLVWCHAPWPWSMAHSKRSGQRVDADADDNVGMGKRRTLWRWWSNRTCTLPTTTASLSGL